MTIPISDQLDHQLLTRIVAADRTPAQLAADAGLSLADLSRWVLRPENLRMIEGLARLSDVLAQMILSRYRSTAAAHLIQIAAAAEPTEISRKACVDLLTTDLDVFPPRDAAASEAALGPGPPAPSEETILAALKRLAAEADAENDEPVLSG